MTIAQTLPSVAEDSRLAPVRSVSCPLCHAPATAAQGALEAGTGWQCIRCGQRWDASRLAAVAAYAAWSVDHDRERREGDRFARLGGEDVNAIQND